VAHLEFSARDFRGGDDFKIGDRDEVPDLQLAPADDGQRRRLHTTNADNTPSATSQDHGRGTSEGQIVDLIGLTASDSGIVKPGILGVRFGPREGVADGLRILRGEQHSHHLAAVVVMFENFLADQLTFAVAVGCEPDPLGAAQRLANGFELGGLVTAYCWPRAVKTLRSQEDRRPALPFRNHIFRFKQIDQVSFGRKNVAELRTNGGADVPSLAGFFGDDDLIGHGGLIGGV